ncbi:PTS fructose transporter subunit IIB [Endozoicomonas euniceicola]|uniref:protein-N(pi)-phosphohistidine--D-fructose phosphotransferase n=1 Tax=Endozoicomonas euniceicola TaxID=1234143 RepID=A0ABY6GZ32_9GAMM|nr:PTS fructose transporter subunit IIB [Endozoicomonas euniceicola]UYM18063.1 PTS fructose transporter subunit IIB [Endozoicomonas euniceicola]
MKVVVVTACPTGIAHTYMAAEKLTEAALLQGYDVKVETQGAMGIENEITPLDIKEADIALFAVDIAVEGEDRFDTLKVVKVPVAEAIRNPDAVMTQLGRSVSAS